MMLEVELRPAGRTRAVVSCASIALPMMKSFGRVGVTRLILLGFCSCDRLWLSTTQEIVLLRLSDRRGPVVPGEQATRVS
jgi:hypothetical protein